eukprot:2351487-Rhodomonas_salina.4
MQTASAAKRAPHLHATSHSARRTGASRRPPECSTRPLAASAAAAWRPRRLRAAAGPPAARTSAPCARTARPSPPPPRPSTAPSPPASSATGARQSRPLTLRTRPDGTLCCEDGAPLAQRRPVLPGPHLTRPAPWPPGRLWLRAAVGPPPAARSRRGGTTRKPPARAAASPSTPQRPLGVHGAHLEVPAQPLQTLGEKAEGECGEESGNRPQEREHAQADPTDGHHDQDAGEPRGSVGRCLAECPEPSLAPCAGSVQPVPQPRDRRADRLERQPQHEEQQLHRDQRRVQQERGREVAGPPEPVQSERAVQLQVVQAGDQPPLELLRSQLFQPRFLCAHRRHLLLCPPEPPRSQEPLRHSRRGLPFH